MDTTTKLIAEFHSKNKIRVWSLVITIFGDCINPRGGKIAMAELQKLICLFNIEPGALRTAMSRLAKEKWLTREKAGRNSFYKISKKGLKLFAEPTQRIYAKNGSPEEKQFFLCTKEPGNSNEQKRFEDFLLRTNSIALNKQVFLADSVACSDSFMKTGNIFLAEIFDQNAPSWVRKLIFPDKIKTSLLDFFKKFHAINVELINSEVNSQEALIARILLIHEWRRIILRIPSNPFKSEPNDWPLRDCRSLVATIYKKVAIKSEEWWRVPLNKKQEQNLLKRFR